MFLIEIKQSSEENLDEVGFEQMTSGLQVQCSVPPSDLSRPMMGPIPVDQYLCYVSASFFASLFHFICDMIKGNESHVGNVQF